MSYYLPKAARGIPRRKGIENDPWNLIRFRPAEGARQWVGPADRSRVR